MTGAHRLLPDFIIIGAMKCGTTSLYRYLDAHPDIDMSRDKETDFFVAGHGWENGLDWYSAQFSGAGSVRGEASPNYAKRLNFPGVPGRMAEICPQARLIYILRDPVDRVESHLRHSVIMGTQVPSAEDFADGPDYAHMLDTSRYAHQLDAYRAHFDNEAILVLDFDDLRADPQAVMDRVCAHVGASRHPIAQGGARNDSAELGRVPAPVLRFAQSPLGRRIAGLVGRETRDRIRGTLARGRSRSPEPFPEYLRERLRADLAEDTARLREMTGLRLASWSL